MPAGFTLAFALLLRQPPEDTPSGGLAPEAASPEGEGVDGGATPPATSDELPVPSPPEAGADADDPVDEVETSAEPDPAATPTPTSAATSPIADPPREPAPMPPEVVPDSVSATPDAAPLRTTVNGRPCPSPAYDTPRLLLTMAGHHPCEEARYDARGGKVHFYPAMQAKVNGNIVGPFELDTTGESYDDLASVDGRLRLSPRIEWPRGAFKLSVDFVSGRWTGSKDPIVRELLADGDPPRLPAAGSKFPPTVGNTRIVDPRELWVQFVFPRVGAIRVGQQSMTWGSGLLANDADNADRFGDLRFGGDGYGGSIYERLLFATKPFQRVGERGKDVLVAIGGDLVYRDDNAELVEGDLAAQALLVVRYDSSTHPGNSLGGYAVFRHQRFADDHDPYPSDDLLQIGAVDLAGQGWHEIGRGLSLLGAFEGVVIAGRTTVKSIEESEQQTVIQGGAAVRAYIGEPRRWLVGFDGGYASGDSDPNDDMVTNFKANRAYTAGLLLFPYIHGWQSARARQLAEDDELSAVDPQASDRIPTGGAVTNAIHVHPKARLGIADAFEVWGGPLFAFAPSEIHDPYASRVGGGSSRNSRGGDGSRRFMGTELDIGMRARANMRGLWLQGGVEGGILFPGAGLADEDGETESPAWGVFLRGELRY